MKIDGNEYKPLEIKKVIINGKEQSAAVILPEQTEGLDEINITVYTNQIKENKQGTDKI